MSYIDIFVLAFAVLGLLFGLFGKASRKIMSFIVLIVSLTVSFFTCGLIANAINGMDSGILSFIGGESGMTISAFLSNKIGEMAADLPIPVETITGMIGGLVTLIVFWLESLLLTLLLDIISKIVWRIVLHKKRKEMTRRERKKNTAIRTGGVLGLIKGAVIAILLVLPVFAFVPVFKAASSFEQLADNEIVSIATEQVDKSFVVKATDKLFSSVKVSFMQYKVGDSDRYLYDDLKSIETVSGSLNTIMDLFMNEDPNANPLQSIASMSDDDLRELFNNLDSVMENETIKEIITDVIPEDLGIDVTTINFSNEADAFILIKNSLELDEQGNIENIDLGEINTQDFVDAVAKSDLVEVVSNMVENIEDAPLKDLDNGTKDEIQSKLQAKVGTGEGKISQDKFDNIMKLFGILPE